MGVCVQRWPITSFLPNHWNALYYSLWCRWMTSATLFFWHGERAVPITAGPRASRHGADQGGRPFPCIWIPFPSRTPGPLHYLVRVLQQVLGSEWWEKPAPANSDVPGVRPSKSLVGIIFSNPRENLLRGGLSSLFTDKETEAEGG